MGTDRKEVIYTSLEEIIELCRTEALYHKKKSNCYWEEYFNKQKVDSVHSYVLGVSVGYELAYERILRILLDLEKDNTINKKGDISNEEND